MAPARSLPARPLSVCTGLDSASLPSFTGPLITGHVARADDHGVAGVDDVQLPADDVGAAQGRAPQRPLVPRVVRVDVDRRLTLAVSGGELQTPFRDS